MLNRFRKILFFAAGAKGEPAALKHAHGLARHHGAQLLVMGTVDEVSTDDPRVQESIARIQGAMIRERFTALAGLIADAGLAQDQDVAGHVAVGKDYVEAIHKAVADGYDMIVKSVDSRHAIRQAIFGGTDLRLIHYAPCPVMLLKPGGRKTRGTVLVAVDSLAGSGEEIAFNTSLLAMGATLTETLTGIGADQASLHAAHVLDKPYMSWKFAGQDEYRTLEKLLTEEADRKLAELAVEHHKKHEEVELTGHLLKGKPHVAIADFVKREKVDLLVMGSVARSGMPGILVGNTAEKILDHVAASVLVLKPEGWRSPLLRDG